MEKKELANVQNITGKNYSTGVETTFTVGDTVRWFQRGLNRWLHGEITAIRLGINPNMSTVTVWLSSGKEVKTKVWQLI